MSKDNLNVSTGGSQDAGATSTDPGITDPGIVKPAVVDTTLNH